jgi:hypothetical protein
MGGQGLALIIHKNKTSNLDLKFIKMSNLAMKHRTNFLNIYLTSTKSDNGEDEKITIQMMKIKEINNGKNNQM